MSPARDTGLAIGLMILAMAGFAGEDFFIKRVSATLPLWAILAPLALGGCAIFTTACLVSGRAPLSRAVLHPLVALRNASEVAGALCFVGALTMVPLTLATAILQLTPLLVTAGAAIWLGEQVGPRRWAAVAVGLAGVLLILRPGLDGFRPEALLAVLATVFLAARDLASRRIPKQIATVQLALWANLAILPAVVILFAIAPGPASYTGPILRDLACATVIGGIAFATLIAATRLGDVSAVVPFRYTRILFALILGVLFLGERPDVATLVGAAIVVASGLYTVLRERKR